MAFLHILYRKYDSARIILSKIIEQNPYFSEGYRYMGLTYLYEGNYLESLDYFNKASKISQGKGSSLYYLLCSQAASGNSDEAFFTLEENIKNTPKWVYPTRKAMVYAYFNDMDNAFHWLEVAYEERDYWLISLKLSPDWDKFRGDPRLNDMLNLMNIPN